jgi:hypothetical protein
MAVLEALSEGAFGPCMVPTLRLCLAGYKRLMTLLQCEGGSGAFIAFPGTHTFSNLSRYAAVGETVRCPAYLWGVSPARLIAAAARKSHPCSLASAGSLMLACCTSLKWLDMPDCECSTTAKVSPSMENLAL